jgi:hypothetical protein
LSFPSSNAYLSKGKESAMIRIIVITLTFAALWSIRWFWFAGPNQAMIENWIAGDTQIAQYSDSHQVGFPNRYDVTLQDFSLAKNGSNLFESKVIQIMRLAYRQDHFVLAFSNDIKILGQNIKTSQNRASFVKQENSVHRIVWEATDITLPNGLTIKHGQLALVLPPMDQEITLFLQVGEIMQNGMVVHENAKLQAKVNLQTAPDRSTLGNFIESSETGFISAKISNPSNKDQVGQLTDFRDFSEMTSLFPVLATLLN